MSKSYPKLKDGEWIQPKMNGYGLQCCDCGLVHKIDFVIIDEKTNEILNDVRVVFRAYRIDKKHKGLKK